MNFYLVMAIAGPLVGVFGTVFGGVMTYRASKRTSAGTVETSNASELWAENDRLMKRLTDQVDRLAKEVDRLTTENSRLNEQVKLLTLELQELKSRLAPPHTNEEGGGA
jgi:predicted nuclease with TOPRIM domain